MNVAHVERAKSDPIEELDDESGSGSDCSIDISRSIGEFPRAVPRNSFSRRSRTVSESSGLLSSLETSTLKSQGRESAEKSRSTAVSVLSTPAGESKEPAFRHENILKSVEELKAHLKTECSEPRDSRFGFHTQSLASHDMMENHPEVEKELRARFFRNKGSCPPLDFGELFSRTKGTPHLPLMKYADSRVPPEESSYRSSLYSFHPEVARAFENGHQRLNIDCAPGEPPAVPAFYDEPALPHGSQRAHNGRQGFLRHGGSVSSTPPTTPPKSGPEFRWQQLISPSRRI
jgi:hypothetical protein